MLNKIISGGQTGADRAALDAALESNFPCGGYCPKNRQAEDGTIELKYPLTEIEGGYRQRTLQNVIHSDGTLIFYENEATGGTLLTIKYCQTHRRPHLLIDALVVGKEEATAAIVEFSNSHDISELNIAGPRASEHPNIYGYVKKVLEELIKL